MDRNLKLKKSRYAKEIVRKVIKAADPKYIKNLNLAEFEKGLIDEVNFIVPVTKKEIKELENYIRQHIKTLYKFAISFHKNDRDY